MGEHLGFSYIGLLFLLMLFIPNIIWVRKKPKGYSFENENKVLLIFERVGEVMTTVCSLVFSDLNFGKWSTRSFWLIAAFALMLMYEIWWVRYFCSDGELSDFYRSFFGIPVAGATLPVAAFFLLGIYKKEIMMLISSVVLGIGHIGIHWQHRREVTTSIELKKSEAKGNNNEN